MAYAVIFSAFVLYPVFEVVRRSVTEPEGFTLQHFQTYFANPRTYRSLVNSQFVAGLSTFLTVSLAFGFAFVLTRTTLWARGLLYTLALLPLVAPSFVQALAFIFLFGRNRLVTSQLLGLEWNICGWPGIVVSEVFYCVPHAKYGLASATFLVFNLVITDFENPVIIGGDYLVLAVEIFTRVIGLQQFDLAAAMSALIVLVVLAAVGILRLATRQWGTGPLAAG